MELDFDKYCVVDGSPTTVLPAPRRRSRKSSSKLKCGNELLSLNEEFTDIGFNRYRSASCRDAPKIPREGRHQLLKRGSVYQSSKEVGLLRRNEDVVPRKKIEFSRGSSSAFSVGIIDSLCSLDKESPLVERGMPLSEQSTSSSSCKNRQELHSRNSIHRSLDPIHETIPLKKSSSSCKSKKQSEFEVDKTDDDKSSLGRDKAVGNLHKSLSAKLDLPHSPAHSDTDGSKASSPRGRLHPVLKMFDHFDKSKSHRSPLNCAKETRFEAVDKRDIGVNCNETVCRSLLTDISDKAHSVGVGSIPQLQKKGIHNSLPPSTPAHLRGLLKMEWKQGMLFFEFSVNSPEDVYVAKMCKVDNPLSWAYTFHSLHHRRRSSSNAWGLRENSKESSMVGQMLVSCYTCTELKGAGAYNDSMVTEFVLHDVSHLRMSVSSQDSSCCSPDLTKPPIVSDEVSSRCDGEKHETPAKTRKSKNSRDNGHCESSQPVAATELHPGLEIAAIIMQVPFEKRESLKFKSGDRQMDKPLLNLLDLCQLEQENDDSLTNTSNPGKLHVVIPAGNHSLPSTPSRGPTPLLDRWKLGGGCDCGGWDMACPLNVCGNPNLQISEGQPLFDTHHSPQLFIQGRKDKEPAFTMRAIEDGKYVVDFHAQLSSLQAFSICVALLHAAEASTGAGRERSEQMLQSDSLRVFAEEEMKHLIDTISEEKFKAGKMEDALPSSFALNPPFSPIARV
ncbi:hypothetical protein SASPL_148864 [Salvia splendens]|uniref:Uncharacterized protein n=1 Tax=Salvia splendens TaxID=180675 RepID=A0A8X8WB01_SALSN|nr:uncharacterized protein LOC121779464 [Salvia splendens]XP_042032726.1 uncharacterized protein LOC121779464 [Salvia splendens]XP_042032727.1 uncharacterized protein LOC121779464 [Salvia splendens]KAG6391113.1 hypothetical protein SASPL_148864 [Salvia splendens]